MATDTLQKFQEFPPELRLEVWRIFLEDEVRSRRVVVWDGRVMPFAHLASPLLRVNIETREKALEFYPIKVKMYLLPETGESLPMSEGRLRQLVAENQDIEDAIREEGSKEAKISTALAKKAHYLLKSAQLTAPEKGALYLNPARDTMLHGYNCGIHFFVRKATDFVKHEDIENPTPLWRTFSSKIPTAVLQSAQQVLRVLGPHLCLKSLEIRFFQQVSRSWDATKSVVECYENDKNIMHPVLSLEEKESEDLMSHLSRPARPLPSSVEAWFGWKERKQGRKQRIILISFEDEINRVAATGLSMVSRAKEVLEEMGETSTSSEQYQDMKKWVENLENSATRWTRDFEDLNTDICAYWRERWN